MELNEPIENKIVANYRRDNSRRISNFLSRISIGQIFVIGILAFIIISMTNNPTIDKRYYLGGYLILFAIILALYFKTSSEKKILPDYVVKEIAQEALNRKVREGKEFAFDSKAIVLPQCHLKYENDMITGTSGPVAWEVGFIEKVYGSNYKREGVIRIHPYEGFVTGISWMPLGYSGKESRDRDIIPVGVVQGNIKTTEWSGSANN